MNCCTVAVSRETGFSKLYIDGVSFSIQPFVKINGVPGSVNATAKCRERERLRVINVDPS